MGTIAEFREASRLEPGNASLRYNLGSALQDSRDLDGAIADYRESLSSVRAALSPTASSARRWRWRLSSIFAWHTPVNPRFSVPRRL